VSTLAKELWRIELIAQSIIFFFNSTETTIFVKHNRYLLVHDEKKLFITKGILFLSILLTCSAVFGQNVGINETNPTNTLHIRPFSPGDEPLRVEGLTALTNGDNAILIHNPSVGVVRYISMPDLSDSVWVNIYNNPSFLDSIVQIIYNYGDTLLYNQSFITNLQDSIDTHLDSLTFDPGTNTLTGWVSGNPYSVDLPVVAGPQGPAGEDGLSAYEIWLNQGNIGDEDDFIASLQGDPGPQGPQGDPDPDWNITSVEYNTDGNIVVNTDQPAVFTTTDRAWLTEGNLNTTAPTSPIGDPITDDYLGTNDARDFAVATTNERRSASIESYLSANAAVNVSGDLRFSTNNDNLFTEKMRIVANGNVGIGATDPLSLLHLRGLPLTLRMENPNGTTWGLNSTNAGDFRVLNFTAGPSIPLTILGANDFVGLGTTFPSAKLHMHDGSFLITNSTGLQAAVYTTDGGIELYRDPTSAISPTTNGYIDFKDNQTDDYDVRIYYNHSIGANGAFQIETSTDGQPATAVGRMYILNENGRVGICTSTPDQLLTVNGNASKPGGGNWAAFSDERVKYDVVEFEDGLEQLMHLRPVKYKYNSLSGFSDVEKEYIGFIAQEIEEVASYMVTLFDDTDGPSGLVDKRQLDESALTKILVNAVQEQQQIIERQQKEIEELKASNNQLTQGNQSMTNDLHELKAQMEEVRQLLFNRADK
jgi:hypothetical protein